MFGIDVFLKIRSYWVTHELMILLPGSPKCYNYWCEPPHPVWNMDFNKK